jgi:hypothetical protein
LTTGSMPGIAASTVLTWLFGSAPNAVEAPLNSLASEITWAWISRPITTSHGPVRPSSIVIFVLSVECFHLLTRRYLPA